MARIQYRRDSTANWTFYNPILAVGEPGFDYQLRVYKVGDGVTPWLTLPEFTGAIGPGTLTTAQLSNAMRVMRDAVQQNRSGAQKVAQTLKQTIRLVRGDFDDVN